MTTTSNVTRKETRSNPGFRIIRRILDLQARKYRIAKATNKLKAMNDNQLRDIGIFKRNDIHGFVSGRIKREQQAANANTPSVEQSDKSAALQWGLQALAANGFADAMVSVVENCLDKTSNMKKATNE